MAARLARLEPDPHLLAMVSIPADVKQHPAARLMPAMDDEQFAELVADIHRYGQREPITLHEGMVLDGWHRRRACVEVGAECRAEEWAGEGDPAEWVASVNLTRRHLTPSQRAAVAAELAEHYRASAAERRRSGTIAPIGAMVPEARGKATEHAAAQAGASTRSTERAQRIKEERPDLFEKVKAGEQSVSGALGEAFPKAVTRDTSRVATSRGARGVAAGTGQQLSLFAVVEELQPKVDAAAARVGISSAEWLRMAVDRELARSEGPDHRPGPAGEVTPNFKRPARQGRG